MVLQALAYTPTDSHLHYALARSRYRQQRFADASVPLASALRLTPGFLPARRLLGALLAESGRAALAVPIFTDILTLHPDDIGPMVGLALSQGWQGNTPEALQWICHALALAPHTGEVWAIAGTLADEHGEHTQAGRCFQHALHLAPQSPRVRRDYGCSLIRQERWKEAWKELAHWLAADRGAGPRWDGAPLADRTLVLYPDTFLRGHGDRLMLARYAPFITGGRVVLVCPPPLVRLLQRCPGVDAVIAGGYPPPPSGDVYCPLLNLPVLFHSTPETVPPTPSLTADPVLVKQWYRRLKRHRGLKVRLCWAGNPCNATDARRSCRLTDFAPLSQVSGVTFYSLQKGEAAAQAQQPPAGLTLHDYTTALHDFADTTALIAQLDLVITVDTAVAHLAGALGKPTWTLLSRLAEWRWGLEDSTPWYPTMRLFRQSGPGQWAPVLTQVAEELRRVMTAARPAA